MKIAIPVWQNTVSNVFDFASHILLIEIDQGAEIGRRELNLPADSGSARLAMLRQAGAEVLICGAISQPMAQMAKVAGLELLAYVTGNVDDVLQGYMNGSLGERRFAMPGCWNGARKGFGRWQRNCRRRRRSRDKR